MAKIGRFVTDAKARAHCQITLDSGDKIIINHDKGALQHGWVFIERLKLMGFSSERLFFCDLDGEAGRAALASLTRDAEPRTLDATPLGAFVKYLKTCQSIDEVKAHCSALMALHRATDA